MKSCSLERGHVPSRCHDSSPCRSSNASLADNKLESGLIDTVQRANRAPWLISASSGLQITNAQAT
jgi:hypothetical protein